MRYLSISIALFGLAGLCGCGGGGGASIPALGTVTGKVTVGGQPLANAVVTFTPASGRPSAGTTGSDGTYKLMYNVDNAGATIGEHTVLVSAGDDSGDYEGDGEDEGDEDEGDEDEGDEDEGDAAGGLPAAASDGSIKKDVSAGANTIDIEL
ncbi:MAG: hypothetical protein ABGZ23_06760 [Fuerstiella sp.]